MVQGTRTKPTRKLRHGTRSKSMGGFGFHAEILKAVQKYFRVQKELQMQKGEWIFDPYSALRTWMCCFITFHKTNLTRRNSLYFGTNRKPQQSWLAWWIQELGFRFKTVPLEEFFGLEKKEASERYREAVWWEGVRVIYSSRDLVLLPWLHQLLGSPV